MLLPIEAVVWSEHYGTHSVLIVGQNEECDALRVTNFKHHTTSRGWIFRNDFERHVFGITNQPKFKLIGHIDSKEIKTHKFDLYLKRSNDW